MKFLWKIQNGIFMVTGANSSTTLTAALLQRQSTFQFVNKWQPVGRGDILGIASIEYNLRRLVLVEFPDRFIIGGS